VNALCEFATVACLSAGIVGEILQKLETWLQCRQQVAKVLSSVFTKLQCVESAGATPKSPAVEAETHNSFSKLRQEKQR
jgi:hypothetical protein